MAMKYSLKPAYTQEFGPDQTARLSDFFQTTLYIPDVSWKDLAVELEEMSDEGDDNFECILGFYRYLSGLKNITINELR